MKKIAYSICLLGLLIAFSVPFGCTSTQQTVAYKTLYGIEVATTGAYDGYTASVIKGLLPTNNVPKISHAYNDFQSAMGVAVALAQNNSNAIAPPALVSQSTAVIQLITNEKTR